MGKKCNWVFVLFILFISQTVLSDENETKYGVILNDGERYVGTILKYDYNAKIVTFKEASGEIIDIQIDAIKYQTIINNDEDLEKFNKYDPFKVGKTGMGISYLKSKLKKGFSSAIKNIEFSLSDTYFFNLSGKTLPGIGHYPVSGQVRPVYTDIELPQDQEFGSLNVNQFTAGFVFAGKTFLDFGISQLKNIDAEMVFNWPTLREGHEFYDSMKLNSEYLKISTSLGFFVSSFANIMKFFVSGGYNIILFKSTCEMSYHNYFPWQDAPIVYPAMKDDTKKTFHKFFIGGGLGLFINKHLFVFTEYKYVFNNTYEFDYNDFNNVVRILTYEDGQLVEVYSANFSYYHESFIRYKSEFSNKPVFNIGVKIII